MKNNRCFVWAFSLLAPLAVMAQDVTEFAVSQPGTLSELVPQADYTTLSDVKITGTVDARDFFFIRDNLTRISTVDMTEATIAACEVEGGAACHRATLNRPPSARCSGSFSSRAAPPW